MVDNQHQKIKGYRDLEEIQLTNTIKSVAEQVGSLFTDMEKISDIDKRWLAIAKTDLQKGFMALVRSIAKPTTF